MLPVVLRKSKPRDIALHADCGKETIKMAALAAVTIRVFLPRATLPRAFFLPTYYSVYILQLSFL